MIDKPTGSAKGTRHFDQLLLCEDVLGVDGFDDVRDFSDFQLALPVQEESK